jgi:sortase A
MARLARILSIALLTAAAVVMLDVALTLAYREPVSSVYGTLKQNAAEGQLEEVEAAFKKKINAAPQADSAPEKTLTPAQKARRARSLARSFGRDLEAGQPLGRIVAPKMDLDAVFLNGTDTSTLQEGPGHYPDTSLPGQAGTVAIAGHRTTYLAPFREIAKLKRGDEIKLDMPYGVFTYRVTGTEIVTPDRIDVIEDVGYPQLVLSACHPLYSAAERYIVFARLVDIEL